VKHEKVVFVRATTTLIGSLEACRFDGTSPRQRYDRSGTRLPVQANHGRRDRDLLVDPHFAIWSFHDLVVVGYNSSHHDDPKQQHHGLMTEAHCCTAICSEGTHLHGRPTAPVPRASPSIQYSDPTPEPDLSLMVNAEQLQELLREFRFDILVHGHKHLPRFTTQSFDGSPDIAILCSGVSLCKSTRVGQARLTTSFT